MSAKARLRVLAVILLLGACGEGDPNARLYAAIDGYCALAVRCVAVAPSPFPGTVEECSDAQMMGLAMFHHVYGAGCIDAYLEQVDCRLEHDCDLSPELSCPDGGVECELRYPCEELVPAAARACGGFSSGPDLGIGTEAQ
ncbi:MAG: hypothetical protein HKN10_11685 [Myxococcales bacterium]|nr:hypothetical protein [Myxococcales bacterium]